MSLTVYQVLIIYICFLVFNIVFNSLWKVLEARQQKKQVDQLMDQIYLKIVKCLMDFRKDLNK